MNPLSQFSDHLLTLYLPGAIALWCAAAFGLAALWGYTSALAGDTNGLRFGRRAYRFFTLALAVASGVLFLSLLLRDFRIEYVHAYSGLDLPTRFQLAAFWAGQKGSFLIWLLFGAIIGLFVHRTCSRRDEPLVMGVYLLTLMGLVLVLLRENPFVMLNEAPLDGKGLNPLLQDEWMVIHPPIMFVGYALTGVPFAFAIAAMLRHDYRDWAHRAFPWTLASFLVLGLAILLGGAWAYRTLGWGGYWGWDPVENASLIPWILSVASIHGLYLERTRGRYRRANLTLVCLGFLAVLYGTFLTRSGVLADFSVHSFVDLGISGLLLTMMGFFGLLSFGLLVLRIFIRPAPTRPNEDPLLSRGSFLVLSTLTVITSGLVIAFGTSAPLITTFMQNPAQVGPAWYNKVNMPLAILATVLLAWVPFLTWKGESFRAVLRKMVAAHSLALVVTVILAIWRIHNPFHLLLVFFASSAAFSNLQKTIARARVGGLSAAGGYLAHVGVGVILLGFLASTAYDYSTKITLEHGVTTPVADVEMTFVRFIPKQGREKERMEVRVDEPDGDSFFVYPKLFINERTRALMANPDIRKYLAQDLYVSPIQYDPGQQASDVAQIQLTEGDRYTLGPSEVRFASLDMAEPEVMVARLQEGGEASIGATLEITVDGTTHQVQPQYTLTSSREVLTPPVDLPTGGQVVISGLDPRTNAVQLTFFGLDPATLYRPATLAIDITRKPLINLVWFGLAVILFGGLLAMIHRLRQVAVLDDLEARGLGQSR